MRTQLKNMDPAALVRNGYALSRATFASLRSWERLAQVEGLAAADAQVLALVLWQLAALERELAKPEVESLRLGQRLGGSKRLLQMEGLHVLSAIGLLVEIGDIGLFATSTHLGAYAGLAPSVRHSSHTERRGKLTKQGRKRLRTIVVHAILSLIRQPQTPLADCYARKRGSSRTWTTDTLKIGCTISNSVTYRMPPKSLFLWSHSKHLRINFAVL